MLFLAVRTAPHELCAQIELFGLDEDADIAEQHDTDVDHGEHDADVAIGGGHVTSELVEGLEKHDGELQAP